MPTFETSTVIQCRVETAFEFLARPANVVKVTRPEVQLTLVEFPEYLEKGSRLKFQLAGYGPVQHFEHEITQFEPNRRFVEEQVTGPLQSFVHEHVVEPSGTEQVAFIDRIDFEAPGGLLGFIVTDDRIRESLQANFEFRHQALKSLLE